METVYVDNSVQCLDILCGAENVTQPQMNAQENTLPSADDQSSAEYKTEEVVTLEKKEKPLAIGPIENISSQKITKLGKYETFLKKLSPNASLAFTHTTRVKGKSGFGNIQAMKNLVSKKSKNILSYRDLIFKDRDLESFEFNFDVIEICKSDRALISVHPDNCAWYVNCTSVPDAAMMTYFNGYINECPYPQLFSELTLQCEDFNNVRCKNRFEPKSPCEYRVNKCHESSHCVPCWVRYASCRGLNEGLNPWEGMEWEPFFVECHNERTVFQGLCDSSAVFSPITRACETPMSIPSKHGGWKPGCQGRRDGFYPDELGRCELYYKCKNQLFRGFHSCQNGFKFNPFTSSCEDVRNVPFPCGDRDGDMHVCQGKEDGSYLDVFGRCTHYFSCQRGRMSGFHVCSKGAFNVEKGSCDAAESASLVMSAPCGELENSCHHRNDGVYLERDHLQPDCVERVVCERGITIAKKRSCFE
ncbi:hypothetical protein Btru_027739 [Bulinus truncatus]|nr:hypothetical protein Btru_027739 [Bulinus truncatus]